MKENMGIFMRTIDPALLEEAQGQPRRRKILPWLSVAAVLCIVSLLALPLLQKEREEVTFATLSALGYDMRLPEEAQDMVYLLQEDRQCAQVSFRMEDTDYVYRAVRADGPAAVDPAQQPQAQLLSWNAESLDLQLLSAPGSTCVSWYTAQNQTQWYLSAEAAPRRVLTTARAILQQTGLDVTAAPAGAERITYNAFALGDMTVAETSFLYKGAACSYRMAGTGALMEQITDISALSGSFSNTVEGQVRWCRAQLSYNEGRQGKIVWFDVVPGILYSFSMDRGASEQALLEMAELLFEPVQDNN